MSAGQQIDLRIDTKFSDLSATVRGIIKDTVKNQYIKKESFAHDESSFGKELFQSGKQSQFTHGSQQQKQSSKRSRMQEPIDLRSPSTSTPNQRKKKQEQRFFPQGLLSSNIFSKSLKYEQYFSFVIISLPFCFYIRNRKCWGSFDARNGL